MLQVEHLMNHIGHHTKEFVYITSCKFTSVRSWKDIIYFSYQFNNRETIVGCAFTFNFMIVQLNKRRALPSKGVGDGGHAKSFKLHKAITSIAIRSEKHLIKI